MKVLIAGDFCDNGRVSELLRKEDFPILFGDVKKQISDADYSIVNFEFPIASEKDKPIAKCGPNLKGTLNAIEALKYAGFNCATLANNHILDYGALCGMETKNALAAAGLDTVGFGKDEKEAAEVLFKQIDGKTLAVINCCEHEFSIATGEDAGACGLNPPRQFKAIKEAREKADYILVIVHGGVENFNLPTPSMKETYRFFIESGADAVVGHHQHCFCGFEVFNGKPILYGLGNFLFDWKGQRGSEWNLGAMAWLEFGENVSFTLYPYRQCDSVPTITILTGEDLTLFKKKEKQLCSTISDDSELLQAYKQFTSNYTNCYRNVVKPTGRLLGALHKLHLLPGFTNLPQRLALIDYISCESHRERFLEYLKTSANESHNCL